MRLWTSHFTPWSLNDLVCKVGIIKHTSPGFARLREMIHVKAFGREESPRKEGEGSLTQVRTIEL